MFLFFVFYRNIFFLFWSRRDCMKVIGFVLVFLYLEMIKWKFFLFIWVRLSMLVFWLSFMCLIFSIEYRNVIVCLIGELVCVSRMCMDCNCCRCWKVDSLGVRIVERNFRR